MSVGTIFGMFPLAEFHYGKSRKWNRRRLNKRISAGETRPRVIRQLVQMKRHSEKYVKAISDHMFARNSIMDYLKGRTS